LLELGNLRGVELLLLRSLLLLRWLLCSILLRHLLLLLGGGSGELLRCHLLLEQHLLAVGHLLDALKLHALRRRVGGVGAILLVAVGDGNGEIGGGERVLLRQRLLIHRRRDGGRRGQRDWMGRGGVGGGAQTEGHQKEMAWW